MTLNRPASSRRGAMLMMVLVLIVVGSIVAMRMLPNEELIERRVDETELHTSLSQIREAFEMKFIAEGFDTWPELDDIPIDPADPDYYPKIQVMLQNLVDEGFLRSEHMFDPTVPPHLWGPDKGRFWRMTDNIASYSKSFVDQWNMDGADAEISPFFLWLPDLDDYPNQNKLGDPLTGGGGALKITK